MKSDSEDEEERYQPERKRKGKAPTQKKHSSKKPRTTTVVIREPEQERWPPKEESSDEEYTSIDEPDFEDDVSLEDEEFWDQRLADEHCELVHPPVERVEYLPWQVELDDDLMEDMKHFNTKKLQDAFKEKDDNNKQVKCRKVLHFPSLDELVARNPFLSYMHALGFDWLLDNGDRTIPVRLTNGFFITFRFNNDLDEVSISFRVFGRELSMNLDEWKARLRMCILEEAISSEWRNWERGIPRRHVEFEPQAGWEELTHPAASQFASTTPVPSISIALSFALFNYIWTITFWVK